MNIFEKISAIMTDIQYLTKDDHVSFGNTSYKALSEEKVTSIMRAELLKYKLVVYPLVQTSSRTGSITHVDVVYRMVNVENPEEYIDIASCGDGADTQDKGSGKAMTYAFKYMWLRTFALPTGEDPDKISSAELDAIASERKKSSAIFCESCGAEIEDYDDGRDIIPAAAMAKRSRERYGKTLCIKCGKEAQRAGAGALRTRDRAAAAKLSGQMEGKKWSVEVKERRGKRSLDANAYCWVLLDKLSIALGRSKTELYRQYVKDIGGNCETVCVVDKSVDKLRQGWEHNGLGWPTETMPSKLPGCTVVLLYYGSSTYDTAQMSRLISLIIEDCKAQGIETMTPAELSRLMEAWDG